MMRKQRKSLPCRRLGHVILIIIKSSELLPWISLRIINALRSHMKYLKECFIRYPNSWKVVKKNSVAPHFFNPLSFWMSDEMFFLVLNYSIVKWVMFELVVKISYRYFVNLLVLDMPMTCLFLLTTHKCAFLAQFTSLKLSQPASSLFFLTWNWK